MKKQKKIRIATVLLLAVLLAVPLSSTAAEQTALHGTLNWDDDADHAGLRPETVTVHLYADGIQIAETRAIPDDWSFTFRLDDVHNTEYSVSAELPVGYGEASELHVDPSVHRTEAAIGTWTKYEPCSELNIPMTVLSSYVIAGKLTERQTAVIWSSQPLTEADQSAILTAFRSQPGVGKLSNVSFISGDGASERGMTVSLSDGMVSFEAPCNWALLFGATFEPADYEVQDAAIALRLTPVLDGPSTPPDYVPDPEQPEEPGPEIDIEEEPEQEPETKQEPKEPDPEVDIEQKPEPEPEKKKEPSPPKGSAPEPEKDPSPKQPVTEPELDPEPSPSPEPKPVPAHNSEPPAQPKQVSVPESSHETEAYVAPQPSPKTEAENKPDVQSPVTVSSTQASALDEQPKTGMPAIYTACEVIFLASAVVLLMLLFVTERKKERH